MINVYLDWAATTAPDPDILRMICETAERYPGNPSSPHADGREAALVLEGSRRRCASALCCNPAQIVFTSGGTESNSIVFQSILRKRSGGHIVISGIEHASVYESANVLRSLGCPVSIVPAEADGRVSISRIGEALRSDTVLVSVMMVNNETGAVQPVAELGKYIEEFSRERKRNVHFHCDAVQALGKIRMVPSELRADSVSVSAHKINGPRGAGLLYVKKRFDVLFSGGGQEEGMRPGTENVAGVFGMSHAIDRHVSRLEETRVRSMRLCTGLIERLIAIPGCRIVPEARISAPGLYSPFIVNASFPPVPGEVLVRVMSDRGYSISTGSACSTSRKKHTRILENMGVTEDVAFSSIRISTGHSTTEEEIDGFCTALERETASLLKVARA